MKNKNYFLRTDLETYSKKFLLLCNTCTFEFPKRQTKKETDEK